jgi:hypothetical protein
MTSSGVWGSFYGFKAWQSQFNIYVHKLQLNKFNINRLKLWQWLYLETMSHLYNHFHQLQVLESDELWHFLQAKDLVYDFSVGCMVCWQKLDWNPLVEMMSQAEKKEKKFKDEVETNLWMVSFWSLLFHPKGKKPLYTPYTRHYGPQADLDALKKKHNFLALLGINHEVHSIFTMRKYIILTPLHTTSFFISMLWNTI